MSRLTEKEVAGCFQVNSKNIDYHSVVKDKYGFSVYRGEHIDKLAGYENAEEQGLLMLFPCPVHTTVYVIPTKENSFKKIAAMELLGYSIGATGNVANLFSKDRFDKGIPKIYQPNIDDFGVVWFLTEAEAREKAKEMDDKEEKTGYGEISGR